MTIKEINKVISVKFFQYDMFKTDIFAKIQLLILGKILFKLSIKEKLKDKDQHIVVLYVLY